MILTEPWEVTGVLTPFLMEKMLNDLPKVIQKDDLQPGLEDAVCFPRLVFIVSSGMVVWIMAAID